MRDKNALCAVGQIPNYFYDEENPLLIKMKNKVRVAVLQSSARGLSAEANFDQVQRLVVKAANAQAELALGIELFNRQFFPSIGIRPSFLKFAEPIPGPTFDFLSNLARKNAIYLAGSFYEQGDTQGLNYDSIVLFDPNGKLVEKYRKSHIPMIPRKSGSGNYEKYYFAPGNTGFKIADIEIGNRKVRIGMLICYDRNFPEAWRSLGLNGAEIVLLSSSSSAGSRSDKPELHEKQICSHAYENGYFVVSANRCGVESKASFYGRSCIVDPWGKVISRASPESEPQVLIGEIDLSQISSARARSSHFRDRRPELYRTITRIEK